MIENPKEIQKYLVKNQEKNNLRSELFKQIGKDGTTGQSKIIRFFQNGAEYFDLGFAIFFANSIVRTAERYAEFIDELLRVF